MERMGAPGEGRKKSAFGKVNIWVKTELGSKRSGDQVIRENPASRGTETSAEELVGPPWRIQKKDIKVKNLLKLQDTAKGTTAMRPCRLLEPGPWVSPWIAGFGGGRIEVSVESINDVVAVTRL